MSVRTVILAATALVATFAVPAYAVPIVGVRGGAFGSTQELFGFDSATPNTVTSTLAVTGLGTDLIRGLDFRPSNGQLYALTQGGGSQPYSLATINTVTGAAVRVGPITSTSIIDFGFAFNPVPDAIRVVNGDNTNLRVNPTTAATITDTPLAFAVGDVNFGQDPIIGAVAYTNQVAGASTTMLFGIDVRSSSLVRIDPPNGGVLNTVGSLNTPLFQIETGVGQGFDIDAASGVAFASLLLSTGGTALSTINLTTGRATEIARFTGGSPRDITVGQLGLGDGNGSAGAVAVPEPASMAVLGIGLAGLIASRRRRG